MCRSGEMVDTCVSGAYGEIHGGSSPPFGNSYLIYRYYHPILSYDFIYIRILNFRPLKYELNIYHSYDIFHNANF